MPYFAVTEDDALPTIYTIVDYLADVHFEMWVEFYDSAINSASPYWQAQFATIRLKYEPNNQEAAELLAQLMLLENRSIQMLVNRFFDNA